jgi:hypothetical protein
MDKRWPAHNATTGELVGYHVRKDRPDGTKDKMPWEDISGNPGLNGFPTKDLSLYPYPIESAGEIVVVEGEKCADALIDIGIPAVGTVCGAQTCPGDDALRPLVEASRIVLWPDNDDGGRRHMSDIARRLHGLGATNLYIVDWADAPDKGDCANAIEQGIDVERLITEAAPIPPPPPVAELLDGLVQFVGRFLVLSDHQHDAVALWIAHTYIFDNADCTPYLNVFSAEKRCGKTLLLEILELLVANPWLTVRATTAVLARKIDQEKSTLLLDETDAAFNGSTEYSEAVRGILNSGYRRGGRASVCVGQGSNITYRDFETFCPKAFAGIGRLPGTIADRSIDIQMKRKTRVEKVERFRRKRVKPDADVLSEALTIWAEATRCYAVDIPLPEELDDRAQDIWEVLFQIAEEAGAEWSGRARTAALGLSVGIDEEDSHGIVLLTDIRAVFDARGIDRLPSTELAEALTELEESPWGDLDGRSLDARKLARLLKSYGIKPDTHRMGAEKKTTKGYLQSDFKEAWSRYVPSSGNNGNKSSTPHNDGVNAVIGNGNDTPSGTDLLPIGHTTSSASTPGGRHVVTDVTDKDGGWETKL